MADTTHPGWWPKDRGPWITANDLPTPLGFLSSLDPDDPVTARKLLAKEKSQLSDGLLSELIFDRMFDAIAQKAGQTLLRPNLETIIARSPGESGEWLAFVWPHERMAGIGRYLLALEEKFRVLLVSWDPERRQFFLTPVRNANPAGPRSALAGWVADYCAAEAPKSYKPEPYEVADSARSPLRHDQIWQHLAGHYGRHLSQQVTLTRILINYGIQPWFRYLWNVDRILIEGDTIWALELKHKFPGPKKKEDGIPLYFGLNKGQQIVYQLLLGCGIRCLHLVMAKPFWHEKAGAAYLVTDPEARGRVAVLATELDRLHFNLIARREVLKSGAKTSITAKLASILKFSPILIPEFTHLGLLPDTPARLAELSAKIPPFIAGNREPAATEQLLKELRKPWPPVTQV